MKQSIYDFMKKYMTMCENCKNYEPSPDSKEADEVILKQVQAFIVGAKYYEACFLNNMPGRLIQLDQDLEDIKDDLLASYPDSKSVRRLCETIDEVMVTKMRI